MEISLSILKINYNQIREELKALESELKFIHLDIMDGNFVPNLSFGPDLIQSIHEDNARFFYDTHLMISDPKKYIESFVLAGSDCITFHLEAVENPIEIIDYIHSFGIKVGISIKPKTKVSDLAPYLGLVDLVLIMSVEPGFGGQKFMPEAVEKLKYLKDQKQTNNYTYWISVDGGINDQTLSYVAPYVDLAVVGSHITCAKNPLEKLLYLKNILK